MDQEERPPIIAPVLPKPDPTNDGENVPHYTRKIDPGISPAEQDFSTVEEGAERLADMQSDEPVFSDEIGSNRWEAYLGKTEEKAPEPEPEPVTITQPEPAPPDPAFQPDEILEGQANHLGRQWQELEAQSASIDWQRLHQQDPQKAEAAWRGVAAKANAVQQAFTGVVARHQAKGAEHLEKVFSTWSEAPQWGEAEAQRLGHFLMELGATPEQIAAETNPQIFIEARRAMLTRDGITVGKARSTSQKVKVTKKKKTQAKPRRKRDTNPRNFYNGVDRISDILAGR